MSLSILSVGSDRVLLHTRAAVLATLGVPVDEMDSAAGLQMVASRRYDLIVLCHSVAETDRLAFRMAARTHTPPSHVMIIDPFLPASQSTKHAMVAEEERLAIGSAPHDLLAAARRMLGLASSSARPPATHLLPFRRPASRAN